MDGRNLDGEWNMWTSGDILNEGMSFLYDKNKKGYLGLRSGLSSIDDVLLGFQMGRLYAVKDHGDCNTSLIFSILNYMCTNLRANCFLISDKYSKKFAGLSLMKFGWSERATRLLYDCLDEEEMEDLNRYCSMIASPNLAVERFYEKDMDKICSEIIKFAAIKSVEGEQSSDSQVERVADASCDAAAAKTDGKTAGTVVFVVGVSLEDQRALKQLAEQLNIAIVMFLSNEERDCIYADGEILLEKSKDDGSSTEKDESWRQRFTFFDLYINNRELLSTTTSYRCLALDSRYACVVEASELKE